jgi:hypothetical protein
VGQHVGSLDVVGGPAGAEVVIEDEVRGRLPLERPIRTRAGDCRFLVRAPGHEPATRAVQIMPGELTREAVRLTAIAPAQVTMASSPPPAHSEPLRHDDRASSAPGPSWHRILPWAALGLTAAAAGFAIYQHVRFLDVQNQFNSHCGAADPNRGGGDCPSLYDDFHGHQTAAIAGYVTAGIAGAGTIVLFVLRPGAGKSAVGPGPGDIGLSALLRF